MGRPGGLDDLLLGRAGVPERDVLADRALEEPRVLEHHPDAGAELVAAHLRDVATVEADRTAVELVEPHDQVHEGGLARAGRADDRDRGAGLGDKVQVADEGLVRVVGEPDVVELDQPARLRVRERALGSGLWSSKSRNSKTRSADAMPDCRTLTMEASWVSGCVNWRVYWMNAWMSPMLI